jgi:hypothetical protein
MAQRPAQVMARTPAPAILRWPTETTHHERMPFFPKTLEAKQQYLEGQAHRRYAALEKIMTSRVFNMEEKVQKVMSVSNKWRVMDEVLERRCPIKGPPYDDDSMSDSSGKIRGAIDDIAYWYVGFWAEWEHPELQTYCWCQRASGFLRD